MTEPGQKMSLLESYEQLRQAKQLCSLGKLINSLDEVDQGYLNRWLDDTDMTNHSIAQLLTNAGHVIHRGTVGDHRRGVCRCSR